ncbi:hypothetical protein G3545_15400 [Starkeya sp. ORNL1]|uniref:hypothetical protein n=1 Tax=Starkeya sp. ORNL1 TaxID=2709380 RepID=UPI0014637A8B|nr:hypothetical protein [Starkeya sp. ORNL1]QJP14910.1 hypothetical protein G3545_15400 [Starkeya sp. ORNL1]
MSNTQSSKVRKILSAAVAVVALSGAMVITSGEAFAGGKHGHGGHHGHRGHGFYGSHFKNFYYDDYYAYNGPQCYYVKKWYGGYKRVIKVCDRPYF